MPYTNPLDDEHDVTVSMDRQIRGAVYATATIFLKGGAKRVGPTFEAEGKNLVTAEAAAERKARRWFFERRAKQ